MFYEDGYMTDIISKKEARRFLVKYHNLNGSRYLKGIDGVRAIMKQLGSIQYDPLNVVGRNADLVLQSRVDGYTAHMLHQLLYDEHYLVDGFDKEMCIYRTEEYPKFANIRKTRTEGSIIRTINHRGQGEALNILNDVREYIHKYGTTASKDISIGEIQSYDGWGHRKLSSVALDYLYNSGELCVMNKKGTQKYYDLTERVLPQEACAKYDFMTIEEFIDWYVLRRVKCVGMLWDKKGGAWQGYYLSDDTIRNQSLRRLIEKGKVTRISVESVQREFYMDSSDIALLNSREHAPQVRFLAPLDNMLWDRNMVKSLFDFEYSWEVYTPAAKRKYGYYVLPVLYGDKLVARFEPEYYAKAKKLSIKKWWWEPNAEQTKEFIEALESEKERFGRFLFESYGMINHQ